MISNKSIVLSRLEEFKKLDLKPLEEILDKELKDSNSFYFKVSFVPLKNLISRESENSAAYIDSRFISFVMNTVHKWGFITLYNEKEGFLKVSLNFNNIKDES